MFIDKNTIVAGKKIWELPASPIKDLHNVCRRIAAEGCVLLENKNNTLPLKKGEKVSVFGRIQNTYYKSGTGSGGLVNIEKQPCIIESLRNDGTVIIDEVLFDVYSKWIADHPFDNGTGWANEPWCQEEMPLSDKTVSAAASRSDTAIVIIGRSSGEDHDNANEASSYQLTENELQMLQKVTSVFEKVVVVLNVGNIIDLSFMDKYPISALIYVWQGGMEGANALADVLCGKVSPCGKLPDTQAFNITDHLSDNNFGDTTKNFYEEDIYIGYRYFETFVPEKVRYPFGFGLTYTNFEINYTAEEKNDTITVKATVTNTGNFPARETVQVYYGAPCGKLGTPQKQLAGYAKTKTLSPYESETVEIPFNIKNMASFDDSGITGNTNCYVLEAGEYLIYAGTDVKNCNIVLKHNINETLVTEKLTEAMAPVENFQRYVAKQLSDGTRTLEKENVPTAKSTVEDKILRNPPKNIPFTGDTGIRLIDVAEGTHTLDEFIAQMTDDDLCNIVCGEGMGSPKVTPGTGGAFGGVTDSLLNLGIPVACVTDGPSGIRLDSGAKAASLPNGTLLAATFDDVSVEEMYTLVCYNIFAG